MANRRGYRPEHADRASVDRTVLRERLMLRMKALLTEVPPINQRIFILAIERFFTGRDNPENDLNILLQSRPQIRIFFVENKIPKEADVLILLQSLVGQ